MTRVKICGITNLVDALRAARFGAEALGFVFHKKSPRYISPYKVRKIIEGLPPFVTPVGVFVNLKEGAVKDILRFTGIRVAQFHGEESPEYCRHFRDVATIKAFRVGEDFDISTVKAYQTSAYLFDAFSSEAYGGTGKTFDWSLIRAAKDFSRPIIISGGINAGNVLEVIESAKPYAVDVSSGVEDAPGKKSERLMTELFARLSL